MPLGKNARALFLVFDLLVKKCDFWHALLTATMTNIRYIYTTYREKTDMPPPLETKSQALNSQKWGGGGFLKATKKVCTQYPHNLVRDYTMQPVSHSPNTYLTPLSFIIISSSRVSMKQHMKQHINNID